MRTVFILGPAGSGKTTLTYKFGKYLEDQGFSVGYVNLDAAVENTFYKPDFDIRTYLTVTKLMNELNIGPNTALIKSVELMYEYREEISKFIKNAELLYDYVLVDTPGQLELVLFHKCCIEIMKLFKGRSSGIFLIPADLLEDIRDLAFLRFLALATRCRLDIPLVIVISKADLIKQDFKFEFTEEEFEKLISHGHGIEVDLVRDLYDMIKKLEKYQRIIKVSSITGEGFDDLHTILYEIFCTCGDLS